VLQAGRAIAVIVSMQKPPRPEGAAALRFGLSIG